MYKINLLVLFIILLFNGCTGKYVDNDLPEADISKIVIPMKKIISLKKFTGGAIRVGSTYFTSSNGLKKAFITSLNASKYFNLQNNARFALDINIQSNDRLTGLGFLMYMITLATLPLPISDDKIICNYKIYNADAKLVKEYTFNEMSHGMLTVFTPFAAIAGASKPDIAKTLADKFVSHLIKNLEKDQIMIYSDTNKI